MGCNKATLGPPCSLTIPSCVTDEHECSQRVADGVPGHPPCAVQKIEQRTAHHAALTTPVFRTVNAVGVVFKTCVLLIAPHTCGSLPGMRRPSAFVHVQSKRLISPLAHARLIGPIVQGLSDQLFTHTSTHKHTHTHTGCRVPTLQVVEAPPLSGATLQPQT